MCKQIGKIVCRLMAQTVINQLEVGDVYQRQSLCGRKTSLTPICSRVIDFAIGGSYSTDHL